MPIVGWPSGQLSGWPAPFSDLFASYQVKFPSVVAARAVVGAPVATHQVLCILLRRMNIYVLWDEEWIVEFCEIRGGKYAAEGE